MPKKFEINQIKIKGGCQSGRKVVTHNSKSDLPLVCRVEERDSESTLGKNLFFKDTPEELSIL